MKNKFFLGGFFSLFILFSCIFTGCENFLNDEEIKEAVVEAIQYGNAPYYTIRVEAVKGSGTIKGNEEVSKRVSDTFVVRFDPDENHQFIKWEAEIPNLGNGESVSDYIVFEDAKSLETSVTFKKANNNIIIRPVCPTRLKASINLSDPDAKYTRDSVIVLTFTEEIDDECLGFININIPNLPEGKTFQDYYREPEKSGNLVIYNPKIDWENVNENDLIPMEENELKNISVFLSAEKIFYNDNNYSSKLVQYLEKDTRFSFTFTSDINKAPFVDVLIDGSNGKFYPAKGKYTVKQFQKKEIEFEPDGDYGFIRWQIYNSITDEEIPDGLYIKIDDPALQKTSYTLIQLPEITFLNQQESEGELDDVENEESNLIALAIRPIVCERPQVISNSPTYSSAGVLRDTTIQVMFDYDMDENSIYYSSDEVAELIAQNVTLLKTTVGATEKYYGYEKNDETFFKNISIINSRNNANLNDKFNAPLFENARTLSIPVKDKLNPGLNIQVTIEKGFYRTQDEKKVSMNQSKKWLYLVNGETDTSAPQITKIFVSDTSGNTINAGTEPTVSSSNVSSLQYFRGGEFNLGLKVLDNTSPSQNFIVNLKKIYDSSYVKLTNPVSYTNTISYTTSYGANAIFGTETGDSLTNEVCGLTGLADGVYGFSITVKDGSGNSQTYPASTENKLYYFCLDSTKPNIAAPSINTNNTTAQSIKLTWSKSGVVDYKETVIRYRKWGTTDNYSSSTAITGETCTLSGLQAGTRYEIIADYKDYAGNVNSVPVRAVAYTRPAKPKTVTLDAEYGTSVKVTAVKPDTGNCSNIRIRYKLHDGSSWNEFGSRIIVDANTSSGSQTITPSPGYKYDFEVCSYDSASSMYSEPYYTSGTTYPLFITAPKEPGGFVLQTRNPTSMTIKWTAPSEGNCSGYIVNCSTNSSFPSNSDTKTNTIESGSTVTTTFNSLVPGTTYYFRIYSYYVNQENKTAYTTGGYYTKCAAATGLTVTPVSNSSMKVAWTKPVGGFSSYKLYYKKSTDEYYVNYVSVNKSLTETTVTGLSGGVSYDFRLETIGEIDAQQNSLAITGYKNHPNPVQNLKAIKVSGSNTSYTLSWSKPASGEYDEYEYYVANSVSGLSSASATTVYKSSESSGNITISKTATANSVVYIKVVACRTVGSNTLKTESTPICCSLALDSVQGLTATASSKTQINLSWTNPLSSGYDGIRVYRGTTLLAATDATGSTPTISKSATSYSATGLTVNTNYNFTITTYKKDTATNVTLTADNFVSRYTLSNPLTSFTASAKGPKKASLSWSYPASGTYSEMHIYRGNEYVDYWSTTISSDYNVPAGGTSYTFKVVTTNGDGVENTSEAKTYTITTPPETVTDLTAAQNSTYPNTRIDLSWTKPGGNYTGVKVYYKTSSDTSYSLYNTYANNTTTSCAVTGLTAGNTYNFKVESYLNGVSNIGTTSEVTTSCYSKPYAASLSLSSRSYNSITYSWSKPSGYVGGYYFYYKKNTDSSYTKVTLSSSQTSYSINTEGGKIYNAYIVTYGTTTSNTATSSTLTKATPLATPGSFSVYQDGDGTKVSWSSPANASSSTTTYYVYYRLNSSTWSYKTTSNTYYKFANTDLTGGGYYSFYVSAYNYINSEGLSSTNTSTSYFYAPPRALGVTPSIYSDDAMGTVILKWTNPTGRSDIGGINVYIDSTPNVDHSNYAGYVSSYTNGAEVKIKLKIPNYRRGTSHSFYLEPYHNKNSGETQGPAVSTYIGTSSYGNIMVNGTTYSYSKFENVITSNYTVSNNTSRTGGAFPSGRIVTLSKYSMAKYEVTQQLFKAVMGTNPSSTSSKGDYYPVTDVNWYAAIAFCNKLSVLQGLEPCYTVSGITDWANITYSSVPTSSNSTWNKATFDFTKNGYHLPTEAQWEFAARGGLVNSTTWTYEYAGSNTLNNVAWTKSNSGGATHEVGNKTGNRLGLYDMSGNVWEWLTDWNYNVPDGTFTDPFCAYDVVAGNSNSLSKKESKVLAKGNGYQSSENRNIDYNSEKENPYYRGQYGFRICRNVTVLE